MTSGSDQICIVCEEDVDQDGAAPGIHPGDWFICKNCDRITPDRAQAEAHWRQRYPQWSQQAMVKEAAKQAYDHLVALDELRMLTVGGLIIRDELKKALEP